MVVKCNEIIYIFLVCKKKGIYKIKLLTYKEKICKMTIKR